VSVGKGPKPYKRYEFSTIFLRIPHAEWSLVSSGRKTEFRASPHLCPQLWNVRPPVPVVAYTVFPARGYRRALMVCERAWREPLGAISPESLAAELQPDIAHFRRAWMIREHRSFEPMRQVSAFRVRPWAPEDDQMMGQRLLRLLYGEHLDSRAA
jgi:hypothetical protein